MSVLLKLTKVRDRPISAVDRSIRRGARRPLVIFPRPAWRRDIAALGGKLGQPLDGHSDLGIRSHGRRNLAAHAVFTGSKRLQIQAPSKALLLADMSVMTYNALHAGSRQAACLASGRSKDAAVFEGSAR